MVTSPPKTRGRRDLLSVLSRITAQRPNFVCTHPNTHTPANKQLNQTRKFPLSVTVLVGQTPSPSFGVLLTIDPEVLKEVDAAAAW